MNPLRGSPRGDGNPPPPWCWGKIHKQHRQTLSYTIDVYRKKIDHNKDFIAFMAFVSFFPQLVAGPIERAKSLLPQFSSDKPISLNNLNNGLRMATPAGG